MGQWRDSNVKKSCSPKTARPALGDGVGLGLAKLCLVCRRKPGRSAR